MLYNTIMSTKYIHKVLHKAFSKHLHLSTHYILCIIISFINSITVSINLIIWRIKVNIDYLPVKFLLSWSCPDQLSIIWCPTSCMISHYNFEFQITHIHWLEKFYENDVDNRNMIRMNKIGGLYWKGKLKFVCLFVFKWLSGLTPVPISYVVHTMIGLCGF